MRIKSAQIPASAGIVIWLAGCAFAAGAVVGPEQETPRKGPDHVAGRLIVKLSPDAARRVAPVGTEGKAFPPDQIPIETLRQLSRKYRVTQWKPLFANPPKHDMTGLARVYVLSCDPSVDIEQAAAEFSALHDLVEYAQPDRIVHLQPVQ